MSLLVMENMTKLDIIIYVFILLFCVIGLFKGFVKIIYSLLKGFVSLIGAYFLTSPLCNFLTTTSVYTSIRSKILEWTIEKSPSLNNIIDINNYEDQLKVAVDEAGIPNFIGNILSNVVTVSENETGLSVGEVLSSSLTHIALTILSFVTIFIALSVLIFLIFKIFKNLVDKGGFKIVDKLLGLIGNGAIALFLVCMIFLLFNAIGIIFPSIDEWLKSYIYIEGYEVESFSMSRYIYENNPLKILFENLFN